MAAPMAITVTCASGDGATRTMGVAATAIRRRAQVRRERANHRDQRLGHDRDRRDLEAVDGTREGAGRRHLRVGRHAARARS